MSAVHQTVRDLTSGHTSQTNFVLGNFYVRTIRAKKYSDTFDKRNSNAPKTPCKAKFPKFLRPKKGKDRQAANPTENTRIVHHSEISSGHSIMRPSTGFLCLALVLGLQVSCLFHQILLHLRAKQHFCEKQLRVDQFKQWLSKAHSPRQECSGQWRWNGQTSQQSGNIRNNGPQPPQQQAWSFPR